jgi:hypothetical protein
MDLVMHLSCRINIIERCNAVGEWRTSRRGGDVVERVIVNKAGRFFTVRSSSLVKES